MPNGLILFLNCGLKILSKTFFLTKCNSKAPSAGNFGARK